MKYRKLGALEVSSLGLGCMGMNHGYGNPADKKEMINVKMTQEEYEFYCKIK